MELRIREEGNVKYPNIPVTQRQGDVYFKPIKKVPDSAKPDASTVLAVGKSGKSHVLRPGNNYKVLKDGSNTFLVVTYGYALVDHLGNDHYSNALPECAYEVRRQRELTPFGWMNVVD